MALKPRHVPQRTCVGCRSVRPKKELIRVVRKPTGEVEIDLGGKVSGRGAYICPSVECLRAAVKGRRLDRALQVTLADDTVRSLEEHVLKLDQ